jgi:dienelactone hydrolase
MTVYATYRHPAASLARLIPAVVLIPGNALTDRNGNTPLYPGSINEIEAVADWLSADGVASLRYDRLGSGQTGFGPYADNRDTIVADISGIPFKPVEQEAAAALRFLARQQGIDRDRLGVIAHSEGAVYALLLAAGADPPGSGSGPLPHVHALGLIEPFHESWTGRYAPARLVAGLPSGTAVFVTCSTADLQVTCAEVSHLRAWLAGAGAGIDFVPLTGVDHVLKQDPTGAPGNYTKPLPFSGQLRQALRTFVQENL